MLHCAGVSTFLPALANTISFLCFLKLKVTSQNLLKALALFEGAKASLSFKRH